MIDVVMPQMGESIVEGTLTKWLKKAGEKVERDEPLFEISTDKVDTEIPSPAAGVLKEVLVEEGKTVAISTVVGRIDEGAGNGASAPAAAKTEPAPAPPAPEAQPAVAADSGPLSPLVKKMAREYGIDLRQVRGTGAGGRISKQDLEAYMSAQGARTMEQVSAPAAPSTPSAQAAAPASAPAAPSMPRAEAPRTRIEP